MTEACGCIVEYWSVKDIMKIRRVNASRCYAFMTKEQKEEVNK